MSDLSSLVLPDCATVSPPCGGLIGMTACPGRRAGSRPDPNALAADLAAIRTWGARILVTLAERDEWPGLGAAGLDAAAGALGLEWRHAPIPDMQPPTAETLAAWRLIAPDLLAVLAGGGRIMIHCAAGLGRTGTMAATLLVQAGVAPTDAIARVREARPGAVETDAQMSFVLDQARLLPRAPV